MGGQGGTHHQVRLAGLSLSRENISVSSLLTPHTKGQTQVKVLVVPDKIDQPLSPEINILSAMLLPRGEDC